MSGYHSFNSVLKHTRMMNKEIEDYVKQFDEYKKTALEDLTDLYWDGTPEDKKARDKEAEALGKSFDHVRVALLALKGCLCNTPQVVKMQRAFDLQKKRVLDSAPQSSAKRPAP